MEKAYATIPEAQQYSGVSRSVLYKALQRGDLTAKKLGRRTLIPIEALDAFLAALPACEPGA